MRDSSLLPKKEVTLLEDIVRQCVVRLFFSVHFSIREKALSILGRYLFTMYVFPNQGLSVSCNTYSPLSFIKSPCSFFLNSGTRSSVPERINISESVVSS